MILEFALVLLIHNRFIPERVVIPTASYEECVQLRNRIPQQPSVIKMTCETREVDLLKSPIGIKP